MTYYYPSVTTDYMTKILDGKSFKEATELAIKELTNIDFDSFGVSGNSGTVFGGALALQMDKGLFIVRKKGDGSHSTKIVEGAIGKYSKYIFLDDMVCTGDTLLRVKNAMIASFPDVTFMGTYLYSSGGYSSRGTN